MKAFDIRLIRKRNVAAKEFLALAFVFGLIKIQKPEKFFRLSKIYKFFSIIKLSKTRIFPILKISALTVVLILVITPMFQAFEAHVVNVTATPVLIDQPLITRGDQNPNQAFIIEQDLDGTYLFYTFGPGTDLTTIADPVCGDAHGGVSSGIYTVDISADTVIKAIACNGPTADAEHSLITTAVFAITPPPPLVCPDGNNVVLSHSTQVIPNQVTATFTIAPGCKNIQISLASYQALTPTFSLPQLLFSSQTGFFDEGGPYTLTVKVPQCYFQWDLVVGPVIENLTNDNLYGSRKIEWQNGGTTPCLNFNETTLNPQQNISDSSAPSSDFSQAPEVPTDQTISDTQNSDVQNLDLKETEQPPTDSTSASPNTQ